MKIAFGFFCAILNIVGLRAFIIPDELPSILSVIYSNIPTLKKGTDSRLGWGFRLGDRADFQVLVELGPQTYTQPLANQGDNGANKRNTLNNLANTLYAQRQQEKKEKLQKEQSNSKSEGGQWINEWSNSIKTPAEQEKAPSPLVPKPGIAVGEIDAKSVIPDDSALEELEKRKLKSDKALYKKPTTTQKSLISLLTAGEQHKPDLTSSDKKVDDVTVE